MQAVVLTSTNGPSCLKIKEVETPSPMPGEVRIKLVASALNRRDYWMTRGGYPGTQVPCIPGSDGAGIIDKIGEGVNSSLIGKEVILGHGEKMKFIMGLIFVFLECLIRAPLQNLFAPPQEMFMLNQNT